MGIYAISDLHLSFAENIEKPMDIFGPEWVGHAENLKKNWESMIGEDDTVIIAGDVSWALKFEDAVPDLLWINALPGKKVFVKGNHDLWWVSIKKLGAMFTSRMHFIQNDFCEAGGYAICGSRGWLCPGSEPYTEHDEKIYRREILRLRSSLESAGKAGFKDIIGVTHFPPTNDKCNASGFTELYNEFKVKYALFGHLHGREKFGRCLSGDIAGSIYKLTSLDYLECKPFKLEV